MKKSRIKKSGYIALLGRTNTGKSTLVNTLVGEKVAIVSDKPQTTRKRILGIKTSERGQLVFFDTPGIHKPYFKLNEKMMKEVLGALADADLVLAFRNVNDRRKDETMLALLPPPEKKKVFLVINKIDLLSKSKILTVIDDNRGDYPWAEIIPISALKGDNVDLLENLLFEYLPAGENLYPEDEFTLQSGNFYMSEMIREQLLAVTHQEIPYTTKVRIEETRESGETFYIRAEILVESKSQKKIVIGRGGNLLKTVGQNARGFLERYLERPVYLDLYVRVAPDWRNSIPEISDD